MSVKGIEEGRAKFAYEKVKEITKESASFQSKYRSYVEKLPPLILSCGLGNAIAFVCSKKGEDSLEKRVYKRLYEHLSEYMKQQAISKKCPNNKELIDWIISSDSTEYRIITSEIMAFLWWLKRFAEGMLKKEE